MPNHTNRLHQLLAENRRPFEPIQAKIHAANQGQEGHAAIYLYDPIVSTRDEAEWYGGICPQDFVPALRALQADHITLYTNCPGGSVFAAEAMCQALREHSAKVTMQIEGYAASAATSIACACDEVVATAASKYMIHQAWTYTAGNAEDLRSTIALLDACDASMYDAYERRTGQPLQQIIDWCKAETWFTAADAATYGFIDRVLEPDAPKATAAARTWNLAAYARPPAAPQPAAAPDPQPTPNTAHASADHRARQQQRLRLAMRMTHP